jgi:hypothetical protein
MRVREEGMGCTSQELTATADRRPLPEGGEGSLHKARGARPRATLCFLSIFDYSPLTTRLQCASSGTGPTFGHSVFPLRKLLCIVAGFSWGLSRRSRVALWELGLGIRISQGNLEESTRWREGKTANNNQRSSSGRSNGPQGKLEAQVCCVTSSPSHQQGKNQGDEDKGGSDGSSLRCQALGPSHSE